MHIDADAKLREIERRTNPSTTTLRGRTFTFRPTVPFEAALQLSAAPERDDDKDGWRAAVLDFICAMLVDEDQDDWIDATATRELYPDELLEDAVNGLAEEYVARPTSPSTASRVGRVNTGVTSTSAASPPDSATSAA